ncbi:MAG: ABC transporter substrate-binding protein [Caldimicrobium sp.]
MVWRAYTKVLALIALFLMVEVAYTSTLSFTDKLGRKVSVNVPVKKAVIVITGELIPALNLWDQVVGVSRFTQEECDVYKALIKEKPYLKRTQVGSGSDLNVEAVLKLEPDLIITWTYYPNTIRFLENRGLTVFAVHPESLEELYEVIRLHGKFFGKEKRAERVILKMEMVFKLIRERVDKIPEEKRKRVIYLMGSPTRVVAKYGVGNDVLKLAGGINPAEEVSGNYVDVSVEKIIQWNPDVIFIWGNANYDEGWLYKNSQWKLVNAVKNKRIYKLPKWSTWSPRVAVIALYMAMKIYPEQFKDIDFEKVADDFYREVFGISYYKVKQYEGN